MLFFSLTCTFSCDTVCEQDELEADLTSTAVMSLLQTQTLLVSEQQPQQADTNSTAAPGFEADSPSPFIAACLFGLLVVALLVVYLVTTTRPSMQASMWSIVSKATTAFIASLFVACFRDITEHFTPADIALQYYLLVPGLRFAAAILLLRLSLFFNDEDSLTTISTLGSFVLGLTGIDLFNGILRLDGQPPLGINFSQSPGAAGAGIICCAGMMGLAMFLSTIFRKKCTGSSAESDESEDEGFAIITGFLVSQVVSFALMRDGDTPLLKPPAGLPKLSYPVIELFRLNEKTIAYMVFATMSLLYAMWLVVACSIWSFKRLKVTNKVHRVEHLMVRTLSMILMWCVLRWGQLVCLSLLQQQGQHDLMLARLVAALVFSAAIFLFVFIVTFVLKESQEGGTPDFHALSSSLGLLIGESWMTCFYKASEGFGFGAGSDRRWQSFIQVAVIFVFIAFLTAVWKVYILPRVARKDLASKDAPDMAPTMDALLGSSPGRAAPAARLLQGAPRASAPARVVQNPTRVVQRPQTRY